MKPYATTAVSDDNYNDDNDDNDNNNNNNGITIISDSENVIDYRQLIFEREDSDFA